MFRLRPAFPGGIKLPPRAVRPGDATVRQMPFAPLLHLPLRQHAGPPAVAVVREGEDVVRGQLLAAADGPASLPLHAPATGRVVAIVEQPDPAGGTGRVIQLAPFPGDTQEYPPGPAVDAGATADALLRAIRDAGIAGTDGESGPAHARPGAACTRPVTTLVLNGIEIEPVFGRVPAILRQHAADVLAGTRYLLDGLGAGRAVLAVEGQDAAAAQSLLAAAPAGYPLELRVLRPRYPQGAEEILLRVLSLRADGAVCCNVATVAEIGRLLAHGQCVTDQVVSLVGGALREPGNYRVPLGTPLGFALAHAGLVAAPARVLRGGLMRGEALASLELPVTKGMHGFVALGPGEIGAPEAPLPCIRCGDCLSVCPVQLNPAQLGLLGRKGEVKTMHEEYALDRCFECGCCAYVCPSHIPLVQLFRAAKAQQRRRLETGNAAAGQRAVAVAEEG
jgi:electron transport complex protein RnfC